MTIASRWSWAGSTDQADPAEGSPRVDLPATLRATAERDCLRKPRRFIEPTFFISSSNPRFSEGRNKLPTFPHRSKLLFSLLKSRGFQVEPDLPEVHVRQLHKRISGATAINNHGL